MPKQHITTDGAPQPREGYAQGLRAGDFVYVAGMAGIDPVSGELAGETIAEQTACTLENITATLAAAGATVADVVTSMVHLSDLSLIPRYNAVYAPYFPDPKPVRPTVGSQLPGTLVEIAVVPYLGEK